MNDGIIEGVFSANNRAMLRCGNCGSATRGMVGIKKVTLPDGIEPSTRLIAYGEYPPGNATEATPHKVLGITCGCYAKFHRQIAHIQGRIAHIQGGMK